MSRRIHPRFPCLVGTARQTWRPDDGPAPEPLAMWAQMALAAAEDVGAGRDRVVDEVELWIENSVMVEVMTPEMTADFLAAVRSS